MIQFFAEPSFEGHYNIEIDESVDYETGKVTVNSLSIKEDFRFPVIDEADEGKYVFDGDDEQVVKLQSILQDLSMTNVNLNAIGMLGCDGTTYTLNIHRGATSVTLSWWVGLPEGWEALQPIFDFCTDLHERCFPDQY